MIYIIRNDEFEKNASMQRIYYGIKSTGKNCAVVSRDRTSKGKLKVEYKNNDILYTIRIKAKYGKRLFRIFNLIKYQIALFFFLIRNRKRITTIHSFDLDTGYVVKLFSFLYRRKYVYHIADFYPDSRNISNRLLYNMLKKMEFRVIRKAQTTIICTEERINQIKGSKPKNLKIIHNVPIIKENKHLTHKNITSKIIITYIGSLSKDRFSSEIVDAISKFPQFKYIVGGKGEQKDYILEMSKIHDNIEYVGELQYEEALEYYKKSDLMIAMYDPDVKNHIYAAPNKVYESIALFKPIIYTRGIGLSKLVIDSNSGWLIDYNKNSLESFLKDLSIEKIKNKTNYMKKHKSVYVWEKVKKEIASIYK